jgi:hypothetical protein
MARTRCGTRLLGLALLSLLASTDVFAISPSYIMFYGGQLDAPVVIKPTAQVSSEFLWSYGRRFSVPDGLEGRSYLNYAVFWGRWADVPTRPEAASQHGRLYLPTATAPAVVAITPPHMDEPGADRPSARPIPANLAGFWRGWFLTTDELAVARRLGVPGL